MYVHIYVYMYMYMYAYICSQIHFFVRRSNIHKCDVTLLRVYIHTYKHTYNDACIHPHRHTHTYIHTYLHTNIHTYVHKQISKAAQRMPVLNFYIFTYIKRCIHTYIDINIPTYKHTYIQMDTINYWKSSKEGPSWKPGVRWRDKALAAAVTIDIHIYTCTHTGIGCCCYHSCIYTYLYTRKPMWPECGPFRGVFWMDRFSTFGSKTHFLVLALLGQKHIFKKTKKS